MDEHRYVDDGFDIEFSRMNTLDSPVHGDDNMMIGWRNVWVDGGADNETFTVLMKDLPDLIAVLQRAHERAQDSTRTLRRDSAVTDELMGRDI